MPGNTAEYTQEITTSVSFTESASISAEIGLDTSVIEFIQQSVNNSGGVEVGRTASLAIKKLFSRTYKYFHSVRQMAFFRRVGIYKEIVQPVLTFGNHGYQGRDNIIFNKFVSPDADSAERTDSFDYIDEVPY